jgi:pilus assembly protein FimV
VRNLRLIIIFWLASFAMPGISFALNLGEIDVSSFLNQPLKAEIEVISARPGEIGYLLVSLASRDSFARAGLSRPDYLSDLLFEVKKSEGGDQATVLVTTENAINEPFLHFLIEADWFRGRAFREFTILLDPPFKADSAASVSLSAIEEIVSTSEVNTAGSTETVETTSVTSSAASDSVVVRKGGTLWSIANQFKDPEHSMAQVMLAMQRANPDAFSNNNINNLRIGAVLRAPTADELDQLNKQQAYAKVLEQNGLWNAYVGSVEGTSVSIASGDGGSNGTDGKKKVDGDFSLLTPDDGDSESAGQGEDGDTNKFKTQLALAEEQLDASRIENQEMKSRIAALKARISKFDELQKMVEIEDDSLAQLQADQAENLAVEETEIADEQTAVKAPASVILAETKQKESSLFDGILPPSIINLIQSMSGVVDDLIQSMTGFVNSIVPAATGLVNNIVPAMSRLRDDPVALGGLGAVVILLLGFILYRRRKSSEDKGDADIITVSDFGLEESFARAEDLAPVNLAKNATDADTNIDAEPVAPEYIDNEGDEFSTPAEVFKSDIPDDDTDDSEAFVDHDDVLNEVDVYLAYGLYDKAEELLTESLGAHPDQAAYRAKLLETYFATKNVDDFSSEAELLKLMGSAGEEHWDKVQIMGYELAPDNALFSAAKDSSIRASDSKVAKPEKADFDLDASEDDTNLVTNDFNPEEDSNDFAETQTIKTVADTQELTDESDSVDTPQFGSDLSTDFNLEEDSNDFAETQTIKTVADTQELTDESDSVDIPQFDSDLSTDFNLEEDSNDFAETQTIKTVADTQELPDKSDSADTPQFGSDLSDELEEFEFTPNTAEEEDYEDEDYEDEDDDVDDISDINFEVSSDFGRSAESNYPDGIIIPDEVDINDIGDLMLPDDVDEVSTKLDLARAFIDMGDAEGARSSLEEVLAEGTEEQKAEATQLLEKM